MLKRRNDSVDVAFEQINRDRDLDNNRLESILLRVYKAGYRFGSRLSTKTLPNPEQGELPL